MDNQPDLHGLDVLVIENEPASSKTIARELKGVGANVFTARGFDEAMRAISERSGVPLP